MDIWLWYYARAAYSRIIFQHLKQFQNHIFPPWHRNDTVSYFFLMWTGLPSSGSSRVPTSGTISLGYRTCHINKLASLSVTPWHNGIIFLLSSSQPFFSNTYLNSPFNMLNHLHFHSHLWLNQQSRFPMTCLKQVCLKRFKSICCMEWCIFLEHMHVWYECTSCSLLCMFINITWPTMKRVKACSYHSLSALTQLGHTFQGIQHITLAY